MLARLWMGLSVTQAESSAFFPEPWDAVRLAPAASGPCARRRLCTGRLLGVAPPASPGPALRAAASHCPHGSALLVRVLTR